MPLLATALFLLLVRRDAAGFSSSSSPSSPRIHARISESRSRSRFFGFFSSRLPLSRRSTTARTQLASSSSSSDSSSSSRNDNKKNDGGRERALGVTVLLTVPLAWGTYGPVVKYLYAVQPPVPGLVFSAAYYVVAAVSLLLVLVWVRTTNSVSETAAAAAAAPITSVSKDEEDTTTSAAAAAATPFLPWRGGTELGSYLFVGNVLQVIGLQTVPADRAGFLVQLTTLMVPLVEAALGRVAGAGGVVVRPTTWLACLLAFGGVIVINLDDSDLWLSVLSSSSGSSSNPIEISSLIESTLSGFTVGDSLIVLAAVVYSLHVVRLERYAKETTALQLAASKACIEAVLSLGLVAGLWIFFGGSSESSITAISETTTTAMTAPAGLAAYASQSGREITTFFSTIADSLASGAIPDAVLVPAVGAVLWTGWVTCAYTIYAQSFGQGRVKPTEANLIYTVQPLFTALFAFVLLGETLGPAGVAGGAMIAVAVAMVARAS